jgi:DNA-binding GntR family transcriptional regulator
MDVESPKTSSKKNTVVLSQNEQAYETLQHCLTTLVYKPGEYLNIAVLMNDLELGRTPINHALHRLANEGLVQIIPRKGVMVSPLSIDEGLQMIEVRLANEKLCARLAVPSITADEIDQLKSVNFAYMKAVANRDVPEMMELDRKFHELLAAASRNQVLAEVLRVLHSKSQRFWAISLSKSGHMHEVQNEHEAVVEAMERGDLEAAEQAIAEHIISFKNALVRGG